MEKQVAVPYRLPYMPEKGLIPFYLNCIMALLLAQQQYPILTDLIGGRAQDLHEHIFICARPLHCLPQLLGKVDLRRVQHSHGGILKTTGQLLFQDLFQLLSKHSEHRGDVMCGCRVCVFLYTSTLNVLTDRYSHHRTSRSRPV